MIPVLSATQIREADAYTIANEPVASIDLMERASRAFVQKFSSLAPAGRQISIFCGMGNNGGDGLAIGRILYQQGHRIQAFYVGSLEKASADFRVNYERLSRLTSVYELSDPDQVVVRENDLVIDGLFGSGLARPVEGIHAAVINRINAANATVFAIDMPSGMFADSIPESGETIRADFTITFQTPKLVFFQPDATKFVGAWHVVDIGLNKRFLSGCDTPWYLTGLEDLRLPVRSRFAHKGDAGRLLLVAGSKGKIGAATLSARAALRSGCGLLFIHSPGCGTSILQVNVPEAMVIEDEHMEIISQVEPAEGITTVAIGPGIGTDPMTVEAFAGLMRRLKKPVVIDADGINILAQHNDLLEIIPEESILTPHPGEFRRLVGEWKSDLEKLSLLRSFCRKYRLNVVLKGAYSAVCDPEGTVFYNPTGNPGMATGGTGDVLTGMVAGLLVQGLNPTDALKTAVYLHGLAGDLCQKERGVISLIASDIIEKISEAMRQAEGFSER